MYNSADIAERIKSEAKRKGIPVKKMLGDIGLGNNTMANMKTSMPKADSLAKIADYLGCSVDHLLGKDEENPATNDVSGIEKEALHLFNQISDENREEVMNYLRYMVSKNQEGKKKEG